MKLRRIWGGILAAAGMLFLILDAQTALAGMRSGIELCLLTLIPSLFPFFILSILLTGDLLGSRLKIVHPIGRLCGIPQGAESLLAVGFLGGYPVGAQNVTLAYRQGSISRSDAERMLAFCNNAGPAFLFGIIGSAFDSTWAVWGLWGIHIASALIVAMALKPAAFGATAKVPERNITLSRALHQSLAVMAQVCGWVIVFRTILTYLDRWFLWLLSGDAKIVFSGILELANGCIQLRSLENEGMRFIAASGLLALGGLCVFFQTSSVTQGLSLCVYFPGKLLQAVVSILMALCVQRLFPAEQRCAIHPVWIVLMLLLSLITLQFLHKRQNSSSIPQPIGV